MEGATLGVGVRPLAQELSELGLVPGDCSSETVAAPIHTASKGVSMEVAATASAHI